MRYLAILVSLLGAVSCSTQRSNAPAVALGPGSTVPTKNATLTAGRKGAYVALQPNGTLTVELESNAAAGYQWKLARPLDPNVLTLVSSPAVLPPIALAPTGPTRPAPEKWVFKAVGPGTTKVRMIYQRPDQSLNDTVTYDFTVNAE